MLMMVMRKGRSRPARLSAIRLADGPSAWLERGIDPTPPASLHSFLLPPITRRQQQWQTTAHHQVSCRSVSQPSEAALLISHPHPACPNAEEQLLFASRTDNLDLFTTLVSTPSTQLNVNTTDSFGRTPLHLAVMYQSTDVLPVLLEEEVDVDLQERKEGDTPLHLACRLEGEEDEERRNWIGERRALQNKRR